MPWLIDIVVGTCLEYLILSVTYLNSSSTEVEVFYHFRVHSSQGKHGKRGIF